MRGKCVSHHCWWFIQQPQWRWWWWLTTFKNWLHSNLIIKQKTTTQASQLLTSVNVILISLLFCIYSLREHAVNNHTNTHHLLKTWDPTRTAVCLMMENYISPCLIMNAFPQEFMWNNTETWMLKMMELWMSHRACSVKTVNHGKVLFEGASSQQEQNQSWQKSAAEVTKN